MNAIDFLKRNEKNISNFDLIYCDPPYSNSNTHYIGAWNDENLIELDEYLQYLTNKYNTYSIMNNYDCEITRNLNGNISHAFDKKRMAKSGITMSKNVILTYGKSLKIGLETFLE